MVELAVEELTFHAIEEKGLGGNPVRKLLGGGWGGGVFIGKIAILENHSDTVEP